MADPTTRIEVLETSVGGMQDELVKINAAMNDKFKFMEESFSRLMEAVNGNRESSTSAPRVNPRVEVNQNVTAIQRGDNLNHHANPNAQPHRFVKLKFPRFQAGDPTSWISKAKQYFSYHELPADQRVNFASYHLEEEANEWWQATAKTLNEENIPITWEVFEEELWARFGPSVAEDFDEALSKIRQKGSLKDYHREFERLQNKVTGWSQKALIGTYVGGLKDSISDSIRMFRPTTLKAAIELGRMRDDQLQRSRKFTTNNSTAPAANPSRNTGNRDNLSGNPKKLSLEEMKRKRALGLCFSCDERYTHGHQCKQSQLLLIEGKDVDEDDDDEFVDSHEAVEPEITLQSLTGWSSPKTIRVQVDINHKKLIALIDSGATHCFISEKEASRLGLTLTPTKPFSVRVADGHPLRCHGAYRAVPTELNGEVFAIDFFSLPLSGLDVVIGVSWLETLGPILCDWKAQSMSFDWAGK